MDFIRSELYSHIPILLIIESEGKPNQKESVSMWIHYGNKEMSQFIHSNMSNF